MEIAMLFLVGAGAAFVQRVSGFGLGIFAMLFLPHILPSHTAAATISCIFSCVTSTYNTVKYRKNIPIKIVLPLLCSALIFIPIAVYYSAYVSGHFFKILFGTVLICLSIYFIFFDNRIKIKSTLKNGLLAGALGGTLNGLFSTGGPPIVIYLTQATADNISYFSAIQFYFCVTNIYATICRAVSGAFSVDLIACTVSGLFGCMIGDILGRMVFDKLNSKRLKIIIYIGMIISGLLMIISK